MKDYSKIRTDAINGHLHYQWFEIGRDEEGVIIMCPDGCQRLLQTNGKVVVWNSEEEAYI